MSTYIYISWALGALVLLDCIRRPDSEWVAADREKVFWSIMAGFCGFFALGPVVAVVYVMLFVPLFSGQRQGVTQNPASPPPVDDPSALAPVTRATSSGQNRPGFDHRARHDHLFRKR